MLIAANSKHHLEAAAMLNVESTLAARHFPHISRPPKLQCQNSAKTCQLISEYTQRVISIEVLELFKRNATLAGLPASQLSRLQSVLNAAARLIHQSSRYEHVTAMLRDLHWLRSPERIDFKLAVLTYR